MASLEILDAKDGPFSMAGPVPYIPYLTKKGNDAEPVEYVHTFEKNRPVLVVGKRGNWGIARPKGSATFKTEGLEG